jgi:hypothetical protein
MQNTWVVILFLFSVWMTVDAVRRRAEPYWYLVIFLLPFGSVLYFVLVKLHDYIPGAVPRGRRGKILPGPNAEATSSQTPEERLARALALEKSERYADAAAIFSELVDSSGNDLSARHGLARALLSLGEPARAVEQLAKVVEADRGYDDFRATLDYAEALWQNRQEEDAVELAKALAEHTGRPNHRLAHAHYLAGLDRRDEALAAIDGVLADLRKAPSEPKSAAQRWLKKAEAMRSQLG